MGSSKMMRPQTQEEWEKSQNKIKKVLDPETGRYRYNNLTSLILFLYII